MKKSKKNLLTIKVDMKKQIYIYFSGEIDVIFLGGENRKF